MMNIKQSESVGNEADVLTLDAWASRVDGWCSSGCDGRVAMGYNDSRFTQHEFSGPTPKAARAKAAAWVRAETPAAESTGS